MIDAIAIASSGLQSNQDVLDSISKNISNLNTDAYKAQVASFSEVIEQGQFVGIEARYELDYQNGALKKTGGILDFALQGSGFFELIKPNGDVAYSRVGRFSQDEQGYLTNKDGYYLSGNIRIPASTSELVVQENGDVYAIMSGDTKPQNVGKIEVFDAVNKNNLVAGENSTWRLSGNEVMQPVENTKVIQGHIESSNVEMIDEVGRMMLAQQSYQMNSKIIQTADELLGIINNLKR